MDPSPFTHREPARPTLVQRLLGRKPQKNALVELVRAFDAARVARDVTGSHLARITRDYGFDVTRAFRGDLERMYREYLVHCLTDRRLSEEELADLDHLRQLFCLDAETCAAIQRNVARQVYLRSVSEVLADGTIDENERDFLRRLQDHLGIPESVAENIVDIKQRQQRVRNGQHD